MLILEFVFKVQQYVSPDFQIYTNEFESWKRFKDIFSITCNFFKRGTCLPVDRNYTDNTVAKEEKKNASIQFKTQETED